MINEIENTGNCSYYSKYTLKYKINDVDGKLNKLKTIIKDEDVNKNLKELAEKYQELIDLIKIVFFKKYSENSDVYFLNYNLQIKHNWFHTFNKTAILLAIDSNGLKINKKYKTSDIEWFKRWLVEEDKDPMSDYNTVVENIVGKDWIKRNQEIVDFLKKFAYIPQKGDFLGEDMSTRLGGRRSVFNHKINILNSRINFQSIDSLFTQGLLSQVNIDKKIEDQIKKCVNNCILIREKLETLSFKFNTNKSVGRIVNRGTFNYYSLRKQPKNLIKEQNEVREKLDRKYKLRELIKKNDQDNNVNVLNTCGFLDKHKIENTKLSLKQWKDLMNRFKAEKKSKFLEYMNSKEFKESANLSNVAMFVLNEEKNDGTFINKNFNFELFDPNGKNKKYTSLALREILKRKTEYSQIRNDLKYYVNSKRYTSKPGNDSIAFKFFHSIQKESDKAKLLKEEINFYSGKIKIETANQGIFFNFSGEAKYIEHSYNYKVFCDIYKQISMKYGKLKSQDLGYSKMIIDSNKVESWGFLAETNGVSQLWMYDLLIDRKKNINNLDFELSTFKRVITENDYSESNIPKTKISVLQSISLSAIEKLMFKESDLEYDHYFTQNNSLLNRLRCNSHRNCNNPNCNNNALYFTITENMKSKSIRENLDYYVQTIINFLQVPYVYKMLNIASYGELFKTKVLSVNWKNDIKGFQIALESYGYTWIDYEIPNNVLSIYNDYITKVDLETIEQKDICVDLGGVTKKIGYERDNIGKDFRKSKYIQFNNEKTTYNSNYKFFNIFRNHDNRINNGDLPAYEKRINPEFAIYQREVIDLRDITDYIKKNSKPHTLVSTNRKCNVQYTLAINTINQGSKLQFKNSFKNTIELSNLVIDSNHKFNNTHFDIFDTAYIGIDRGQKSLATVSIVKFRKEYFNYQQEDNQGFKSKNYDLNEEENSSDHESKVILENGFIHENIPYSDIISIPTYDLKNLDVKIKKIYNEYLTKKDNFRPESDCDKSYLDRIIYVLNRPKTYKSILREVLLSIKNPRGPYNTDMEAHEITRIKELSLLDNFKQKVKKYYDLLNNGHLNDLTQQINDPMYKLIRSVFKIFKPEFSVLEDFYYDILKNPSTIKESEFNYYFDLNNRHCIDLTTAKLTNDKIILVGDAITYFNYLENLYKLALTDIFNNKKSSMIDNVELLTPIDAKSFKAEINGESINIISIDKSISLSIHRNVIINQHFLNLFKFQLAENLNYHLENIYLNDNIDNDVKIKYNLDFNNNQFNVRKYQDSLTKNHIGILAFIKKYISINSLANKSIFAFENLETNLSKNKKNIFGMELALVNKLKKDEPQFYLPDYKRYMYNRLIENNPNNFKVNNWIDLENINIDSGQSYQLGAVLLTDKHLTSRRCPVCMSFLKKDKNHLKSHSCGYKLKVIPDVNVIEKEKFNEFNKHISNSFKEKETEDDGPATYQIAYNAFRLIQKIKENPEYLKPNNSQPHNPD